MRKSMKVWSKRIHESLKEKIEEAKSISTMEQNIEPTLFLQVIREVMDLQLKHGEDYFIANVFGSDQNEKFDEVMEWMNEVEKFINEILPKLNDKGNQQNFIWCHSMLIEIRKIRVKSLPNLTFQRVSNVGSGSSSSSSPLSLREEIYCEITSLINVYYAMKNAVSSLQNLPLIIFHEDIDQQQINEVEQFLAEIKLQLQGKTPETNSDWYRNKIVEIRTLIDKLEPEFSLQSQYAGLTPLSLHEELRCEIRLLANMQCVDVLVLVAILKLGDLDRPYKYTMEVQQSGNAIEKFIAETKLQLVDESLEKNSDWYHNKIAESRTLTAKRYSAFPLRSQDMGFTKEQPQIFLSFRGGDTRKGFTNYLYEALHNGGFNVFRDNEGLKRGDSISQVLVGAIEKSKVSIIIFSKNYADSRWCLDEVNKILECKEKNGQLIWPIFYKVEPTDVRNQKNSYEVAMTKQEEKFGKDSEKVKKWRLSLSQIADLKALEYKENDDRPESDIIKEIIKDAKELLKEVARKH